MPLSLTSRTNPYLPYTDAALVTQLPQSCCRCMNQTLLGRCLGAVNPPAFQRYQNERLVNSLQHQAALTFTFAKPATARSDGEETSQIRRIAHQAGVNCLSIDHNDGNYLASGGADATIRLWDLERDETAQSLPHNYNPIASLSRADKSSHSHAITSISIYPFDSTPSTLLTTAHDRTLKLIAITPTSLTPVHSFDLDFAPFTHAISPIPDSSALVAVGTTHPAVRLLDLRSGLSTHSLPGHNGAIYALAWSPRKTHLLASGAHDGRVLFFDIRRANAAFASLDLDDAIGVYSSDATIPATETRRQTLDWNTRAHNGPVTSVQWTTSNPTTSGDGGSIGGDKIVTAGHDQRIRVWDAATGRNDLVHFGPRIRNERLGNLSPLIAPAGFATKAAREVLFWPNDDGKGDVFVHNLREGNLLGILKTEGVDRAKIAQMSGGRTGGTGGGGGGGGGSSGMASRVTSGGRINALVWRYNTTSSGPGLEMYSAHGDGRICAWMSTVDDGCEEADDGDGEEGGELLEGGSGRQIGFDKGPRSSGHDGRDDEDQKELENKRKRKRELLDSLVQGLTKKPVTFS